MLVALLGASTTAQSNTAVKVALIADKASGLHKSPLVSLLEVKLSQKEGIQLLERAEIDKILQEQQLSVAGLLQRHSAVKVGRLLRVDAFLLLSTEADKDQKQNRNKLLRVRLVETAHGLRLLDNFEEPDGAKLEDTVKRITEKVIAAVPKIMLPRGEAIPVGIVDIHRVQLGERYQWLARALPAMLSVRLSKELRIIILEREDLKILHDEKLLTEGEDAEFWSSGVLIDGYLRPSRAKDIEMQLSLRQASDKEIAGFTVLVEPNEPSVAIDKAATRIIPKLLNAPPSASWQPEQEADEFFLQGELLKNHRRHEKALALLETARALHPKNVFYTGGLFGNEWEARSLKKGSFYSDLELTELVSLLVRQIRTEYDSGAISQSDVIERWGKPLGFATDSYGYLNGYFSKSVSVSTEQIRNINRENRRIWVETINEAMKHKWYSFATWPHILSASALLSSDRPEEAMKNLKETNEKMIMHKRMGGKIRNEGGRYIWTLWIIAHPDIDIWTTDKVEKTHFHGSAERFEEFWEQYLIYLTKAKDPIVKFVSHLSLNDWYRSKEKDDLAQFYCEGALAILQNDIRVPDTGFEYWDLQSMRNEIVKRILYSGFDTEKTLHIFRNIYEPLIERNDAYKLALWRPGDRSRWWFYCKKNEVAKTSLSLLERIATVLQKHEKQEDPVLQSLNRVRDAIAEIKNKFPQLHGHVQEAVPSVRILLTKADWPQSPSNFQYIRVLLQNDMLWLAFAKPAVGLAGINMSKKRLIALWQNDCDSGTPMSSPAKGQEISGSITGMAINKDASYIAIRDVGLIELPGSITQDREFLIPPKVLTQKDGLPSLSICGMTAIGDKLWIAYGKPAQESGLIAYNPKTSKYETVLCSTLKGDNPFCMGNSYELTSLVLGPKNNLFFIVRAKRENWAKINHVTGLWRININSKKLKFIWRDKFIRYFLESIEDTGRSWWLKDLEYLARFDPVSEAATLIWIDTRTEVPTAPVPKLEEDFFVRKSYPSIRIGHLQEGRVSLRTATVHDNKLWARLGKSQLIILHKGKGFEEAEIIENNILNGGKVLRFFSTPYGLIAIGEGTVGLIETKGDGR